MFRFIIKYVAPAYLLIVFVGFCFQKLPESVEALVHHDTARNTLVVVGAVLTGLAILTWIGQKRWVPQTIAPRDHEVSRT